MTIQTVYGKVDIEANRIPIIEKQELILRISDGLSIRGKNPVELYHKLNDLIKDYIVEVEPAKPLVDEIYEDVDLRPSADLLREQNHFTNNQSGANKMKQRNSVSQVKKIRL